MRFVVIKSFRDVIDAQICKSQLEAAGIKTFLENEGIISANWLLSTAVGGVELKVQENQVELALKIINQTS